MKLNVTSTQGNISNPLKATILRLIRASILRGLEAVDGFESLSSEIVNHAPGFDLEKEFKHVGLPEGINVIKTTITETKESLVILIHLSSDDASNLEEAYLTVDVPKTPKSKPYIDMSACISVGGAYYAPEVLTANNRTKEEYNEFYTELQTKPMFQHFALHLISHGGVLALPSESVSLEILQGVAPKDLFFCDGHAWMHYSKDKNALYITLHEPETGKLLAAVCYDAKPYTEELTGLEPSEVDLPFDVKFTGA